MRRDEGAGGNELETNVDSKQRAQQGNYSELGRRATAQISELACSVVREPRFSTARVNLALGTQPSVHRRDAGVAGTFSKLG